MRENKTNNKIWIKAHRTYFWKMETNDPDTLTVPPEAQTIGWRSGKPGCFRLKMAACKDLGFCHFGWKRRLQDFAVQMAAGQAELKPFPSIPSWTARRWSPSWNLGSENHAGPATDPKELP